MKKRYFILFSALYILGLYLKTNGYHILFVTTQMNDILALPIILSIVQALMQTVKKEFTAISITKILFACTMLSVFFEWLLPFYYEVHTGDVLDVFAYFCGGVIFYLLQRDKFLLRNEEKRYINQKRYPTIH